MSIETEFTDNLARGLQPLGFRRKNARMLVRERGEGQEQIQCLCSKARYERFERVYLFARLRIESVDKIVQKTTDSNSCTFEAKVEMLSEAGGR